MDPSSAGGPASPASRTRRAASRPVMSRKCSSSTWVVRRRNSAASDASSASRTAGSVGDELAEAISRQDHDLRGDHRRGRRRPGRTIEQGQLAEHVARAKGGEDRLLARLRRDRDLHLARDDDEQRFTRVAGVEDHLAAAEPSRPQSRRRPVPGRPDRARRRTGSGRATRPAGVRPASVRIVAPDAALDAEPDAPVGSPTPAGSHAGQHGAGAARRMSPCPSTCAAVSA